MSSNFPNSKYQISNYQRRGKGVNIVSSNYSRIPMGPIKKNYQNVEFRNEEFIYQDQSPEYNVVFYDSNLRKYRTRLSVRKLGNANPIIFL